MEEPRKPRRKYNKNTNNLPIGDFETSVVIETSKNNKNMNPVKIVASGVILVIILVASLLSVKIVTIEGNQLGVKETWSGGIDTNIMQPKTYFLVPGWSQSVFKYDASSQVFVMNDKPMHQEGKITIGREKDAYLVQSQEGQDMKISLNLRWRLDPSKLINIHKTVRQDIEEKIIRPVVMRVVKDDATRMKAIEAYSGEGLVKLQTSIQSSLAGNGEGKELSERGVIIENFVIEHIELDPKYIEEIKGKQIASQKQLRAVEEQKAAEAEALVAKSKAQAEYNTKLVAQQLLATNMVIQAQADNERVIIAAKAASEQVTIAAEAQKKQLEMEGEGKKLSMIAVAEGTLAMGKAEAASKQLLLDSYKAAGSNAYVQVEIAKAMAEGTKNIQGYLPNNFNPTVISGNFLDAIQSIVGGKVVAPVAK